MKAKIINRGIFTAIVMVAVISASAFGLTIQYTNTGGMSSEAIAAANRAAAQWQAVITNDVTVIVDLSMASLGGSTLGQASTIMQSKNFVNIIDLMKAAASSDLDNQILPYLPSYSQYKYIDLGNAYVDENIRISNANYKALGGTVSDPYDSQITISTDFAWDFDNSDGVRINEVDFESVVLHELGHVLGFVSSLDSDQMDEIVGAQESGSFNYYPLDITPMDLFRFTSSNVPSSPSGLTNANHDITRGGTDYFYTGVEQIALSNGIDFQASHFKNGVYPILGIMDPALAYGEIGYITANDLAVFDLIGWDVVPEPATISLLLIGFVGLYIRPKRKA